MISLSRGESRIEQIKAGTFKWVNFKLIKSTAIGVAQTIDLRLINFYVKHFVNNNSGDVVKQAPLYYVVLESLLDLGGYNLPSVVEIGIGQTHINLSINLEKFIQLVGNDYLEVYANSLETSSASTYTIGITIPKVVGVMDSRPTIDLIQVQNGVQIRTEYLGSDIERIVLVSATDNLTSVAITSDSLNTVLSDADVFAQSIEFAGLAPESMDTTSMLGRVIFDGTKHADQVELKEVSLEMNFDAAVTGSYLVVRRNVTSKRLMNHGNSLRDKHFNKKMANKPN